MFLYLELLKGGRSGQRIVVKEGECYVGRSEDAKIRIPSSRVSRKHCKFILKDKIAYIADLNSVNGTYINGDKISKITILREGDLIVIGPVSFKVIIPTAVSNAIDPVTSPKKSASKRTPSLEIDSFLIAEPHTENDSFNLEEDDNSNSIIPILEDNPLPQKNSSKRKKTTVGSDEFVETPGRNSPPRVNDNDLSIQVSDGANLRDILSQLDSLDDES